MKKGNGAVPCNRPVSASYIISLVVVQLGAMFISVPRNCNNHLHRAFHHVPICIPGVDIPRYCLANTHNPCNEQLAHIQGLQTLLALAVRCLLLSKAFTSPTFHLAFLFYHMEKVQSVFCIHYKTY